MAAAPCFCGMVAWRWGGAMLEFGLRRNMCGEPVGEMPGLWLGLSPDGKDNVPPETNPALGNKMLQHDNVMAQGLYRKILSEFTNFSQNLTWCPQFGVEKQHEGAQLFHTSCKGYNPYCSQCTLSVKTGRKCVLCNFAVFLFKSTVQSCEMLFLTDKLIAFP